MVDQSAGAHRQVRRPNILEALRVESQIAAFSEQKSAVPPYSHVGALKK